MNILHLEMSQFFSRVIEKVAVETGHQYRNERGIQAGLEALNGWDFDLLITSHVLDDGRAEELLAKIVETRHAEIPVIVITSDDTIEARERLFSLGVVDYLHKSDIVPQKLAIYFRLIASGGEILEELRGFRIAVLDDSNLSLHVIRRIFNYYNVTHVEYFSSPRAMLDSGHFDLYILDMVMPEMTGEQVLLELKGRDGRSGVVMVSGITNRLVLANSLELGADDYIAKPFDARDFMARLKGVVRQQLLLRELEERSRQLEDASKRDSLTGLWNHGTIHNLLRHHMDSPDGGSVAVALFDMDNFKIINDVHGHQTGDDVLLATSDVFTTQKAEGVEVGRYGGEEFLVLMPGTESEDAVKAAEHLLEHIRSLDMGRADLKVSASCGVAVSSERQDAMKLVELADERLYTAKEAGKDQVVG